MLALKKHKLTLMKWINAMRPSCGILTALLVISGFRYSHQSIEWSVVIAVFFITSMAMVVNDYCDRTIDIAKGKLLASSHPAWFLCYALVFVVVSFELSLIVWWRNSYFGILCISGWLTSIIYNKLQRNPLAKNMIVSLNVGATMIFPLLVDSKVHELWSMAIFITCIISIREYMKDVEDIEIDRGKKQTLALVMNTKIKKSVAVRLKHLMSLLLVALIIGCLITY